MPKRLVQESEFADLWYHPDCGVVHHQLHKFIWGDAYQQLLNSGLDILVCEGATKWLSENRDDTVHSRADTDWVIERWMPRAFTAGWRYWAQVPPANVLGQMNLERILGEAEKRGVICRIFSDADAALVWLASV